MVGTEKTADCKSAGTWKSADYKSAETWRKSAETTVGRKKKRKEWWAGTTIVPERRGVRKTKKGLEITAHAYVPEDESLQLVGGLADGAATVVGEFFVLKVYEQSQ